MNIMMFSVILILAVILLIIFVYFIKQSHIIRLEKRFDPFSLVANNENEKSFFDQLLEFLWKFIRKFSKCIEKSVILTNYSKRYEKFISFEEKDLKNGLDYISLKFLIAIFLFILNLITLILQASYIHFISLLLSFLIGFFLPDIFLLIIFKQKQKRIEEDLVKAIIIMNNCFKSGRNIMQAINTVKMELTGPIADEFKKIYLDITYGLSIDVVFNRFYERVKLEDAKYIASSLTLLNKTGGNIIKVFSMIEKSVFDRKKLRNELHSLTASSVFVFRVLVVLPFLFIFLIYILNPTYFKPLFISKLGLMFLFLIILLYSIYIYIIRKVLKVKL